MKKCPICNWEGKEFSAFGIEPKCRLGMCPKCGSLERHRLCYLLLQEIFLATSFYDNNPKILHIAPEPVLANYLKTKTSFYVGFDIRKINQHVNKTGNLCSLPFDNNMFDLVLCSHVLEHIEDDVTAMKEIYRVMLPYATAIIQVPIRKDITYEDPSIQSREQRKQHFLQEDHVRLYGLDIMDRLRSVGFTIRRYHSSDWPNTNYGLDFVSTNDVFVCSKHR